MGSSKDKNVTTDAAGLRRRAEEELRLKGGEKPATRADVETRRLIHELQVHQIELEMQNEELRRARNSAETALEKYTDLYDFAPAGYLTLDRTGVIRKANLTVAKMLGVARSQLIGRRMDLFLSEETRPLLNQFLVRAFASDTKETFEAVFMAENHSSIFAQVEAVPVPSDEACRLVVVDISERKRLEVELNRAKDKLLERTMAAEKANRSKGLFLANMSHELRTPMTGVLGMLDIALEGDLDPQQRDCIETASRSARLLLHILNDILDMTMIEEGKLSLEEKEFSLADCMNLAVDLLIPEARRKGIDLNISMTDGLPQTVVGDQLRLRQILTNLIGNAVKFTERGKVEVTVAAGEKSADGRREITFTVSDTGIGIPTDMQHRLFRPFSQVDDSHSRRFGGTGLGLAICRELTERMGGAITFVSREGAGSRFSFTLPLREAGHVSGENVSPSPASCSLPHPAEEARPRLLIAEDDGVVRKVFGLMLENLEFDADFAMNGRETVEKWKKGGYDLVIMDVQMPVMDGFEATAAIREGERERGGHVPILAMTAHALREDKERCLAAGMDAYVSKPIDFKRCIGVIRELLEKG